MCEQTAAFDYQAVCQLSGATDLSAYTAAAPSLERLLQQYDSCNSYSVFTHWLLERNMVAEFGSVLAVGWNLVSARLATGTLSNTTITLNEGTDITTISVLQQLLPGYGALQLLNKLVGNILLSIVSQSPEEQSDSISAALIQQLSSSGPTQLSQQSQLLAVQALGQITLATTAPPL